MNLTKEPSCFIIVTAILGIAFAFYTVGGKEQCNVLLGGAMSYLVREVAPGKKPPED